MFNELQDAQEFLLDPPTLKVMKTASQSVNSNTYTVATWQVAVEDNCKPFGVGDSTAMWTSTSNTRLTARIGGWYEFTYTMAWDTRTDDGRRQVTFDVNDGPEVIWQRGRRDVWHLNDYTIQTGMYPVFLNVGDYIKVWGLQVSGSSSNMVATTDTGRRTQAKLKWVSL